MATDFNILAWKILWAEKPDEPQSTGWAIYSPWGGKEWDTTDSAQFMKKTRFYEPVLLQERKEPSERGQLPLDNEPNT